MEILRRLLLDPPWGRYLLPLLLLVLANTAVWCFARIFGTHGSAPLDFGFTLRNGTRLLGSHKTWRGLLGAALACGALTASLHLGFGLGLLFGALALTGDAASSWLKRRLRFHPGEEVLGLDQLPEALLPLLVLEGSLGLRFSDCLLIALIFTGLDLAVMKLRHR